MEALVVLHPAAAQRKKRATAEMAVPLVQTVASRAVALAVTASTAGRVAKLVEKAARAAREVERAAEMAMPGGMEAVLVSENAPATHAASLARWTSVLPHQGVFQVFG